MKPPMPPSTPLPRTGWRACVRLALACGALALGAAAIAAPQASAQRLTPEQELQLALEAQSARDYRTMLTMLRRSATAGDVQAQELLGLALLVGPTLYGPAVKANRCEAGLWLRKAAAQGSEVGRWQLDFLNRLRSAPAGQEVCQAW